MTADSMPLAGEPGDEDGPYLEGWTTASGIALLRLRQCLVVEGDLDDISENAISMPSSIPRNRLGSRGRARVLTSPVPVAVECSTGHGRSKLLTVAVTR
jgi:hypothetical protein